MVDFSEKHVAILALYTFDLVVRDSQKTSFTKKQLTFKLYFFLFLTSVHGHTTVSCQNHSCFRSITVKPFFIHVFFSVVMLVSCLMLSYYTVICGDMLLPISDFFGKCPFVFYMHIVGGWKD